LLGSAAITGHLHPELLQNPRGGREHLVEGMKRAGLSDESMLSAARPKETIAGYLELHIEQGKRLERAGIDIGVVSAIVGIFVSPVVHRTRRSMPLNYHAGPSGCVARECVHARSAELVMKDFRIGCSEHRGYGIFAGRLTLSLAQVDVSLEFRSADDAELTNWMRLLALSQNRRKYLRSGLKVIFAWGIAQRP
jgi:hypothetical protein